MASTPDKPSSERHDSLTGSARRRPKWFSRIVRAMRAVLIAYLLVVLVFMWLETVLIFPTWAIPAGDWDRPDLAHEDIVFRSPDGTRLHGWYFAHPDPVAYVLYCHGNGEDVAQLGDYMDTLRDRYDVAIFAFDYPGYGKSEGRPNERSVSVAGHAAQTWLAERSGIPANRIVIWGRSLGGALAIELAVDTGARAILVERTFTSLTDVAAYHYPWLPVRTMLRNRFDSLARIPKYHGPLLQSHGTADEVVPFECGRRLFDAAAAAPKQFIVLKDTGHNGPNSEDYYTNVQRFFAELP